MIGTTLGHYKIVETLGQGGMGVVYKARDLKLDRFVALKVLPPGKTADPSRKQRFVQEARAASALNHPNIVIIHDIAEDAGVDFIVMEYIAGKTLDELIPRKGMRTGEVLRHATQMAAALTVAHEAGITHRDLKPGNIMVTDKGVVKILDFGLAKLEERAPLAPDDATLTNRPETEKGTVLGTVAYMSPEQAEGKHVDPRSDIFSLGSVLYEMCTGARAFMGETKMSTLSSIIRDDPKPMRASNEDVPPELEKLIARCMRKNPARRFLSTADLQIALDDLREESDSGRLGTPAAAVAARPARKPWIQWAAIGSAVVVIAAGAVWLATPKREPGQQQGPVLTQLTFDTGLTTEPSYWPQGNLIAYASDRATDGQNLDIWIQQLNGGEARRLTTHESDDRTPDIAPDGSRIVFRSERDGGGLYIVPTIGGAERKIASGGVEPKFSPDGQWIAYWTGDATGNQQIFVTQDAESQIMLVAAAGGSPRPAFNIKGAVRPAWSPDSKHLLFAWVRLGELEWVRWGELDWYVAPIAGGEPKRTGLRAAIEKAKLDVRGTPMRWSPRGVYFNAQVGDSANTWRAALNATTFQHAGEFTRVTTSSGLESHVTVAGDSIVYANTVNNDDVYVLPMDTNAARVTGEPTRLTRNIAPEYAATISHDGTKVGHAALMSGKFVAFIRDLASGNDTRITSIPGIGAASITISPDGNRLVWSTAAQGRSEVHIGSMDGGSNMVSQSGGARSWGGDPPRIFVTAGQGAGLLLDPDTRTEIKVTQLESSYTGVHLSMDGRYIVHYGGSPAKIFATPISPDRVATDKDTITVADGVLPEISPDSKTVYFYSSRDGFQCLWAQRMDLPARRREGEPFAVKHFHSARVSPAHVSGGRRRIDTAVDKIVLTMAERTGNIWRVDLPKDPR